MGTITDSKLYLCTFLSKGGVVEKDYLTKSEFCWEMNLKEEEVEAGNVYLSNYTVSSENCAGCMDEVPQDEETYDDVDDFAAEAERRYFDGLATQAERFSHD